MGLSWHPGLTERFGFFFLGGAFPFEALSLAPTTPILNTAAAPTAPIHS